MKLQSIRPLGGLALEGAARVLLAPRDCPPTWTSPGVRAWSSPCLAPVQSALAATASWSRASGGRDSLQALNSVSIQPLQLQGRAVEEERTASSLISHERTRGRTGGPQEPLPLQTVAELRTAPPPRRPPSATSPATTLPALPAPHFPVACRGCSSLSRGVQGSSEERLRSPSYQVPPMPASPPGGRAWWSPSGAPGFATSKKMLAMRFFTCFLQLLAGLALPQQVRAPPTHPPNTYFIS